MSGMSKARALLAELEAVAGSDSIPLPKQRYVVVGEPVIDCESVIIALTGATIPEGFDATCFPPQLGTFSIIIARDCAVTFDNEGRTIPEEAEKVAELQAADGDFLWSFAARHRELLSKTWSLGYVVTGGITVTSLLLTTGVG